MNSNCKNIYTTSTDEHTRTPLKVINPFQHIDDPVEMTSADANKHAPREIVKPFIHIDEDGDAPNSAVAESLNPPMTTASVTMTKETTQSQQPLVPYTGTPAIEIVTESPDNFGGTSVSALSQMLTKMLQPFSTAQNQTGQTSQKVSAPKPNPHQLMKRFAEHYNVLVVRGSIYIFTGNYYRRLSKEEAKALIATFCRSYVGDEVTTRLVSEVLGQLKAYEPVIDNNAVVDDSLIALPGRILNIRTGGFILPNPAQRCFHYLPHLIDPALVGEQNCPNFTRFLNSVTNGNPALIHRLWELTALLLTPMRMKCLPTLFGPPSSGKSVYISLIKKLHAHGDCFPLTFDRLTDRFSLSYAATANLITYFDIPNKRLSAKETAMLKSLCSTEDDIAVEAKSGAVSCLSSSRLKVLLASNFALRSFTRDEAFEERLTYFIFANAIPKEARVEHLSDLLTREGDAIVSTAILKYLPVILSNNFRFSGEAETAELFEKMTNSLPEDENFVLYDFIDNLITDEPASRISTAELYAAFTAFCGGYPVFESDRKFSEAFAKAIGTRAAKCRLPVNGKSVNGYRGIRLNTANSHNDSYII